jgi:undecaprenyl-diphosphatase
MLEIDRQLLLLLNGSDSVFFDKLIMALTSGFTWIPLYLALLYVVVKNNETTAQILLIIGCAVLCIALADGVADFIAKPYFQRWRPSNDSVIKYAVKVVDNVRGGDYGFFSAHAANTFSLAVFFSLLIKDRLLTLTLVFWSLLNCYTRMYLGLHYPLDILAGLSNVARSKAITA